MENFVKRVYLLTEQVEGIQKELMGFFFKVNTGINAFVFNLFILQHATQAFDWVKELTLTS